jgi:hypothetical protein
MHHPISKQTRADLLAAVRERYRQASRAEKAKILDEFVAVAGCHRKHAIRLLANRHPATPAATSVRRVYDEAVREALTVLCEAADRICGKRLKAILPGLIISLERHGHLALDPAVRPRYVAADRAGGPDGLRRRGIWSPVSDRAAPPHANREALINRPVRAAAEAAERIERRTGPKREPTQVRTFLGTERASRGRRNRAIPWPPRTGLPDPIREQKHFLEARLQPRLDQAVAGRRQVFFVDAAHVVFGTSLGWPGSLTRIVVQAASGRQRFDGPGACDAVAGELRTITNTTVVNTDTRCALLRRAAAPGLVGPVPLVLDNAR